MSNLFLRALLRRLEEAARAMGVQTLRVDYKRNKRGELVIALIVPDGDGPLSSFNIP
jgi:hypothetical protein